MGSFVPEMLILYKRAIRQAKALVGAVTVVEAQDGAHRAVAQGGLKVNFFLQVFVLKNIVHSVILSHRLAIIESLCVANLCSIRFSTRFDTRRRLKPCSVGCACKTRVILFRKKRQKLQIIFSGDDFLLCI
jgi:hypothetical protein